MWFLLRSLLLLLLIPEKSYQFYLGRPPNSYSLQSNGKRRSPSARINHKISNVVILIDRSTVGCYYSKRSTNDENEDSFPRLPQVITQDPTRSTWFSAIMALCGAALGPLLDSYHSAFGVLQYDEPITLTLWGSSEHPALITAWWVPILFGIAGWLIGWLYVALDSICKTPVTVLEPSPPIILLGISLFTLQYYLSGVLVASGAVDRSFILFVMSFYSAAIFVALDGSVAGFMTSFATAVGGPLIEVGLLSLSSSGMMPGGYHYYDRGETGFFPFWITPVYFLGGSAVGNLARGFWRLLTAKPDVKASSKGSRSSNETLRQ